MQRAKGWKSKRLQRCAYGWETHNVCGEAGVREGMHIPLERGIRLKK